MTDAPLGEAGAAALPGDAAQPATRTRPNPDANAYTLGRSAAYNRMGSGAAGVWLASRPAAPTEGAWELDDGVDVLAGPAIEIPLGV